MSLWGQFRSWVALRLRAAAECSAAAAIPGWGAALHVVVLLSFVVSGPMYQNLERRSAFLTDHGFGAAGLIAIVFVLSLLLPAVFLAAEAVAGRIGPQARALLDAALISLLILGMACLTANRVVAPADGLAHSMRVLGLAVALGVGGVYSYWKFGKMRQVVSVAAPVVGLFPALFLMHPTSTALMFTPVVEYVEARNPVPVVMIVFDEFCGMTLLDEDHAIDSVRYPNFAALAQGATWFRNATSVHPRTDNAVPAILTGNYPRGVDQRLLLAHHPQNLLSLLFKTGQYELVAFEPFTRLSPPDREQGIVEQLTLFQQLRAVFAILPRAYLHDLLPNDLPFVSLPEVPLTWFGVRAFLKAENDKTHGTFHPGWNLNRDEQCNDFLRLLRPPDRPRLHFMHVVLPHFSWVFLPSGRKYEKDDRHVRQPAIFGAENELGEDYRGDELAALHGQQRYILQVQFVDRFIGRLIDRLKEVGLYDRCLLVVMADHGCAFRANSSRRAPGKTNLADILSIPMFIKQPGQKTGQVSDRNVLSIDAYPAVTDALGIALEQPIDGQSALDERLPERKEKVYVDGGRKFTVDAHFSAKYETLELMLSRFGSGRKPGGLFRIGPHAELVDRPVAELNLGPPADFQVGLIQYGDTLSEDPAEVVPCFMIGGVAGREGWHPGNGRPNSLPELPVNLAIAVNGTVRAVTRTFQDAEIRDTWEAMLPESAFHVGKNDVQIYAVGNNAGRLTLRPCPTRQLRHSEQRSYVQPP